MREPTHAPGWRGRPIIRGPIVGQYDSTPGQLEDLLTGFALWIGGSTLAIGICAVLPLIGDRL